MHIEPWSEALRSGIEVSFGPPDHWSERQGRSQWRAATDDAHWSRCIVLCTDGKPIAVASAFVPRLHASRAWCYVEVISSNRRAGIGTTALVALRQSLPPDSLPLRAKVAGQSAGAHFAARHGFTPIQRTRTVHVTVPQQPVRSDSSVDVVSGADAGGELTNEVVAAWWNYYRDGHAWDPPGDVTMDVVRELFFGDNPVVLVKRRAGTVAGVALLYDEDDSVTFVGGALSRVDPDAVGVARDLLQAAARQLGSARLSIELDDWMWEIQEAVDGWPYQVMDIAQVVVEP